MRKRIPPWPTLLVWAAFSTVIYVLGSGFGGSFLAVFQAPPPLEYPVEFALWLVVFCLVFAPFILIAARLMIDRRNRKFDA